MRIVIDLQGVQTDSRFRGIGRYSMALAKAIIRNRQGHEVIIALNGLLEGSIETIRAEFEGLLSQENICVWSTLDGISGLDEAVCRESAELIREAFLASLKPDIVLVSSLFEGFANSAVSSISELSSCFPTAVIFYDLIPLIYREFYYKELAYEIWHQNKIGHLLRADCLLTISKSSCKDAMHYLNFPESKVYNISAAADSHINLVKLSVSAENMFLQKNNINRPFVLYTGGTDYRKNVEGLICAYANLSKEIRKEHQLVFVGAISPAEINKLHALATRSGLRNGELILVGFVSDADLLIFYSLCKVFVFPSLYEGFGLPVLEAMSCGKAVIASNTSSIPEIFGCEEALFDPENEGSITRKLERVLIEKEFRQRLERHGLEQAKKFSWEKSACRALEAMEHIHVEHKKKLSLRNLHSKKRPRLAYFSPLPPERSGISDYSMELLPELSRHYKVDIITDNLDNQSVWIRANHKIYSTEWFKHYYREYDRVLYQFGNSPFHSHMFQLLATIPGVVVLHDYFLSSVIAHMDIQGEAHGAWTKALYRGHGYSAVQERYHTKNLQDVILKYPCNFDVFQKAYGIIVHSEHSCDLALKWHNKQASEEMCLIPLLRKPAPISDKISARYMLNLKQDDFIVCSFGIIAPTKCNYELLQAWISSKLADNTSCVLIFIGENHSGDYGAKLLEIAQQNNYKQCIRFVDWVSKDDFNLYLSAADLAVQLRTFSRGETSAAVLDCMNYGLPTIVNCNGSVNSLPNDVVWKLPDAFSIVELASALELLWLDQKQRIDLGEAAKQYIFNEHNPRVCADKYAEAIECFYNLSTVKSPALVQEIVKLAVKPQQLKTFKELAVEIGSSLSATLVKQKQIFVDISALVRLDLKTGVQRVIRSILLEWLKFPPEGFRVEPVYVPFLEKEYRYARRFTLQFLECPFSSELLGDELIEYCAGDIFFVLDLFHDVVADCKGFYQKLRNYGVTVKFCIYDLLCIRMPEHFFDFMEEKHRYWLSVVGESDGAVCISKSVAEDFLVWFKNYSPRRKRSFQISWFHLGADLISSNPTIGLPSKADTLLRQIQYHPSFLMVGTLESRKGHQQTLEAFEQLWRQDVMATLVIIGKAGWKTEALQKLLRKHPKLNRCLFWFEDISDEFLEKIYQACVCLIAASEGEGFGLPLIEAARHALPIIARDIPVFREVTQEHALFFKGKSPENLAEAILEWLALFEKGSHPTSEKISWITWRQSAQQLLRCILPKELSLEESVH